MFIDLVLLFDVNTRAPLVNDVVHDGTDSDAYIHKGAPCVYFSPRLLSDSYYLNQCVFHLFQWMDNDTRNTINSPIKVKTCVKLLLYYAY